MNTWRERLDARIDMSRDELLKALLAERFSPRPLPVGYDDDDRTTSARRKALDDACDGFDIPRSTGFRSPTRVDDVSAGQRTLTS